MVGFFFNFNLPWEKRKKKEKRKIQEKENLIYF